MNNKQKTLLKIVVPITLMIQLTAIIFLLSKANKHKTFSCKTVEPYLVCKQFDADI